MEDLNDQHKQHEHRQVYEIHFHLHLDKQHNEKIDEGLGLLIKKLKKITRDVKSTPTK